MNSCVRPGCPRPALAGWWLLCIECSQPLLMLNDGSAPSLTDQRMAAGWDALDWSERIAPNCWGNARDDDPWLLSVRCLALASVVTGRSWGCAHTVDGASPVPVVAVVRAPGILKCPPCAESLVAETSTSGLCDRCQAVPVALPDRVAALTGSSLIVVAQLCRDCRSNTLELHDDAHEM
jgi:hypothetical protein